MRGHATLLERGNADPNEDHVRSSVKDATPIVRVYARGACRLFSSVLGCPRRRAERRFGRRRVGHSGHSRRARRPRPAASDLADRPASLVAGCQRGAERRCRLASPLSHGTLASGSSGRSPGPTPLAFSASHSRAVFSGSQSGGGTLGSARSRIQAQRGSGPRDRSGRGGCGDAEFWAAIRTSFPVTEPSQRKGGEPRRRLVSIT